MQKIKSKCLKPNYEGWTLFETKPLLILIFFWLSIPCISRDIFPKWGVFLKEELALDLCEFEPEAGAVILGDYGHIKLVSGGFIEIKRRTRIKILKESHKDIANQIIRYYSKEKIEQVKQVKAQTINVVNGKIETKKVHKSSIFDVDDSENWREVRITFPSVNVGSILELEYITVSKSIVYLKDWKFQNKYPTLTSKLIVHLSGYSINYSVFTRGAQTIQKYGGKNTNVWELNNVPSYFNEPFCPNPQDFIESLHFQAASYMKKGPSSYQQNEEVKFVHGWSDIVNRVLETRFRYYNANSSIRQLDLPEFDENLEQMDLVSKMYAFVKDHFKWNGEHSTWAKQKPKELLDSKIGNVAEINLFLLSWMKNYGIEAYPIISSTKENGFVNDQYPFLPEYNNVLGLVIIGGQEILFNAIDPFLPLGYLALNDLNKKGYLIDETRHKWIDLNPKHTTKTIGFTKIEMNKDADLIVESNLVLYGYDGIENRRNIMNQLSNNNPLSEIIKTLFDFDSDTKFDSLSLINLYDFDEPLKIHFKGKFDVSRIQNNVFELEPFLFNFFKENPFVSEERNLPVDLNTSTHSNFVFNFTFPPEAALDAIPENQAISLPNRKGIFGFNLQEVDNQLKLSIQIQQDSYFSPQEYPYLREFRSMISSKLKSPILIKLPAPSVSTLSD